MNPLPPAPDAAPIGRTIGREGSTRTDLVRVPRPELARRAVLERSRKRLVVAAGGFGLLFAVVGFRLADATLLSPAEPRRLAAMARLDTAPVEHLPGRGTIADRNGEILAVSLPVTALYANPQQIENPAEAARRLVRVLPQLDVERVTARLSGERQFAYIARALTPREQQAVNSLGIPGLYFQQAERRVYPQGRSAAHILGGVDVDGNGTAGVEKYFDERLRLRRGDQLRLAVDVRVQLALRDSVQRAITEFNGIGGTGILMDVQTGEVLGMVSLPDFDLAEPARIDNTPQSREEQAQNPRFNRATVGVYEPGSTFKLLTAAMALELGTVNVWGGYDASRPIRYGRFTINDFRGKNRWLALPEILAYSSNLASAHMAAAVGPPRHRDFMVRMGMGSRLPIELPETAVPLIPTPNGWREINTMTIGFGHGISVTPLHVVTGVAAIANGGILRAPTLMVREPGVPVEGTRVLSERTSDTMRRLMRLVVTEGSGKSADVPGYFVGGKTGTAQKTGPRGGYLENKRIAAFVGAFPMNAPRYALYVMVDEPKPNARSQGYATAGWVAAPAAGMVVRQVAPILGMAPETDRAAEIQASLAMPMQPGRPPAAARPAGAPPAGAAPARPAPATQPASSPTPQPPPPRAAPTAPTAAAPARAAEATRPGGEANRPAAAPPAGLREASLAPR
ncbi:peptidoglycan D,D-transpeptidase FtsI family protein [Falsiroseomonas stagni]|uniref:Cell division protein FtsI (Penicillin-binding protein 3) n=1 Tax=Falsiroseomonas stagni DSM 19981 TaxID=1123062 RepID=A0A1I3ZHM5_9PROT|nr:penicillin-binding protein 2 [Falsiroseomonas stagni]SFK43069.1 cell division protein FtsI (penicillin-binding protein 3) [Falsiroseomonas stagni DSM 19981]